MPNRSILEVEANLMPLSSNFRVLSIILLLFLLTISDLSRPIPQYLASVDSW